MYACSAGESYVCSPYGYECAGVLKFGEWLPKAAEIIVNAMDFWYLNFESPLRIVKKVVFLALLIHL